MVKLTRTQMFSTVPGRAAQSLPSDLRPYVNANTGKVDLNRAVADAKADPRLVNRYVTSGRSSDYYSGGGSSSGVSQTYAVTPLEAVKRSAITGESIKIPEFPNTPKGAIDKGNYVAQIARIMSQKTNTSALDVLARKRNKQFSELQSEAKQTQTEVTEYNQQGQVIEAKAKALQEEASHLNTRNPSQVASFNAKVNAFNQEVSAYSSRGQELQVKAQQIQQRSFEAQQQAKKFETLSLTQPGTQGPKPEFQSVRNALNKNQGSLVSRVKSQDTKTPSDVSVPLRQVGRTTTDVLTSYKDKPKGEKVVVETSESLLNKGAFGSVLEREAEATDIVDIATGVKKIGLGIGAVPARFGELAGSSIARVFGQKPVFQENKEFIYESQSGKRLVTEIYSPGKALKETQVSFKENPLGTSIDIGLKAITLVPGGSFAIKGLSKLNIKLGTLKAKYIPAENLVAPEVLAGEKTFPYIKGPKDLLKTYKETGYKSALGTGKDYVYSATDFPFKPIVGRKIVVSAGRGLEKSVDVPALYTGTKGISIYFLRIKKALLDYSLPKKIFPSLQGPSAPKVLAIETTKVARIPKSARVSLEAGQKFFGRTKDTLKSGSMADVAKVAQAKPGVPYITPAVEQLIKKEAEAGIRVGSELQRTGLKGLQKITGFRFYTKIGGKTVPIYEMKPTQSVVGLSGKVKQVVSSTEYAKYSSGLTSSQPSLISSASVSAVSSAFKGSSSYVKPSSGSILKSTIIPKVSSVSYSPSKVNYVVPSVKSSLPRVSEVSSKPSSVKSSSGISTTSYSSPSVSSIRVSIKSPSYVSSRVSRPKISIPSYKKVSSKTSYVPSYTPPRTPPPVVIPSLKFGPVSLSKKKRGLIDLFDVEVRKKGKFTSRGVRLSKAQALRLGIKITDVTTARTFRLKPVGMGVGVEQQLPRLTQYRLPYGKSSLKSPLTFVEKTQFAISTRGEKIGLKQARQLKPRRLSVFS